MRRAALAALALLVVCGGAAGDPERTPGPRIVGRVALPSGDPAPGVRVAAFERERLQRAFRDAPTTFDLALPPADAQGTTDDAGRFALEVPAEGMYVLSTQRRGLATRLVGEVAGATDAPAVLLWTERGRAFTGRVVDDAGQPVAGVVVTGGVPLLRDTGYAPALFGRRETTTDAHGRFQLEDLFLGENGVGGDLAPCGIAVRVTETSRAARIGAQTSPMQEGPFVVLARGGQSLLVNAVSEEGAPIEGASVMAVAAVGADEEMANGGYVQAWGRTDARGACRFEGLPLAQVAAVEVVAPGLGVATWQAKATAPEETGPETVTVKVGRGITCAGTVADEAGKPIEGAEVRALLPRGGTAAVARTDAQGAFRLSGIPDDPSRATGLPPIDVSAAGRVRGRPYAAPLPTPKAGECTVDVRMVPPGSLAGRVVDGEGRPVGGAEVSVGRRRVLAGENGTFLVLGLESDDALELTAAHPDDVPAEWNVSRQSALARTVARGPPLRLGRATAKVLPGRRTAGVEIVLRASK